MSGISSKAAGSLKNKRLYNAGSELQNEEFSDGSGLEWYDVQARFYDPQLGRFMQVDPLVENNQESWEPYQYGYDDPIRYNDPTGKQPPQIRAIQLVTRIFVELVLLAQRQGKGVNLPANLVNRVAIDNTSIAKTPNLLINEIKKGEGEKARGRNNEKTSEAAKIGQEAHRQEQAKLREEGAETEVPMTLKDGTTVRKDAVREDGTTVIIKPDTKTGRASAARREKLMKDNDKKTEVIYYDPKIHFTYLALQLILDLNSTLMKLTSKKILSLIKDRLVQLGYSEINTTAWGVDLLFAKKINKELYLTLGIVISKYNNSLFTGSFYLSKTIRWGSVWGDIPIDSYKRVGSLLNVEERAKLLNDEYTKEGIRDAWWNADEINNFIESVSTTEERFLLQPNLISKIEASKEVQNLHINALSVIQAVESNQIINMNYRFVLDNNKEHIPVEWFMAAEMILLEKKETVNVKTVKLLAIDSFFQNTLS